MVNMIKAQRCDRATFTELKKREKLTESEAFEKYSDEFWVRAYVYVRAKENRKEWNQVHFDNVVKRTLNFMRLKDREAAMRYLHKELANSKKMYFSPTKDLTNQQVDDILRSNKLKSHTGTFLL